MTNVGSLWRVQPHPLLITAFLSIFDSKVIGSLVKRFFLYTQLSLQWGLNQESSDSITTPKSTRPHSRPYLPFGSPFQALTRSLPHELHNQIIKLRISKQEQCRIVNPGMQQNNPGMEQLSQTCANSVSPFDNFQSSVLGKAGTKLEHPSFDTLLYLVPAF